MSNLAPIASLNLHSRRWSAKVLVVEKSASRTPKNNGKQYQRYIFIDAEGSKIQGVCYDNDIDTVDAIIQPLHTYIITNAKIVSSNPVFQVVDQTIQWILSVSTVMEKCDSEPLPSVLAYPTFTKISDVEKYKGTNTNLDILGIVVDSSSVRTIKGRYGGDAIVQDLALITTEKITIVLSMWDQFVHAEGAPILATAATFPVIAGFRLRVQEYRGNSLAAKGNANIVLAPSYPAAESLRTWAERNMPYLLEVKASKPYFAPTIPPSTAVVTNRGQISDVLASQMDGRFIVEARIYLADKQQLFFYLACPSCFRQTTANEDMEFTCHSCQMKQIATPRTKYNALIADKDTQLQVVVFGEVAEKLLGIKARTFLEYSTQGKPLSIQMLNATLANKMYEVQVRKKKTTYQDGHFFYNLMDFKLIESSSKFKTSEHISASTTSVASTPPPTEIQYVIQAPKGEEGSSKHRPSDVLSLTLPPRKSARLSSGKLITRASIYAESDKHATHKEHSTLNSTHDPPSDETV